MTSFSFAGFVRQSKLAVASVAIGASLFAASAQVGSAAEHGAWDTVIVDDAVAVMTSFADGSVLSLAVVKGQFHLLLKDPNWNLRAGQEVAINVVIDDDDKFIGKAEAVSRNIIDVVVGDRNFLKDFIHGDKAVVSVFGGQWNTSLNGSARAVKAMFKAKD